MLTCVLVRACVLCNRRTVIPCHLTNNSALLRCQLGKQRLYERHHHHLCLQGQCGGCVCLWKLWIFVLWCWLNIRPASRMQLGTSVNLVFNTILCCIYRTAVVRNWIELRSVGRCNVFFFQQCLTFHELGKELCFTEEFAVASVSCQSCAHAELSATQGCFLCTRSWALCSDFCTCRAERHAGVSVWD